MNCPLCDTPLEGEVVCPNCGHETDPQIPTMATEPDLIPETGHPGIFYENLVSSQEIYEEERRPRKPARFEKSEKLIILGAVIMLLVVLFSAWSVSRRYDPDAIALEGDSGISMDNRTFSIYYQETYQEYIAQNSSALPFDPNRSLKKQYYNVEEGYSWEDYFISQAYPNAALTARLVAAARESGFTLNEDQQASVDATWESFQNYAENNQITLTEYLQTTYGSQMDEDTYYGYLYDTTLAQAYSESIYYSTKFSTAEIEAYYKANLSNYTDLTVSQMPNVDVRHILFLVTDEDPDALAEAEQNAKDALAQCLSGGAEHAREVFLNLVNEYSQDSGSNGNGGLLENVSPDRIGGEFDQWCFDPEGRQQGELAAVSSQYGWHVVYFEGYRENFAWQETVLADMRTDALGEALNRLSQDMNCHLTRFAAAAD